jgi:N-acyl-D-amino-acid deacylase
LAEPARSGLLGVKSLAGLLAMLLAGCATTAEPSLEADLLLRGGTVYPGGAAPFTGDVAVRGDRILAVGRNLRVTAARTIDATGLIVAPGFIDPHAHMESWLTSENPQRRLVEPFLLQGVTTTFVGNDGFGPLDVKPLLASAQSKPVGINYATFTGFGSIRSAVIGPARRAPTASELAQEQALVREAMCDGALGLSTGLFYAPQSFAETAKVVALAKIAGELGGHYDTHLRDESNYSIGLAASVDEAITIAREARIPVHISHIKALGVDVHGLAPAIIAKVERARAEGLAITADQYPWQASGTSLVAALVPLWAQDGGRAALLKRLDDPALTGRLRAEMAENLRRRGGADSLLVAQGRWKGQRLSQIAAAMATDPVSAAIAAIREADAATISFNMRPADIAAFMAQPWVVTGSDASTGHPRAYGSFAEKHAVYVRDGKLLTLREFIDRSSTMTADIFGLRDRGRLRPGAFADVAVFDPARFAARATYERPELTAEGMRYVLVNGALAVDGGRLTGAAAGRALAKHPAAGCQ